MKSVRQRDLTYLAYIQRESQFVHHTYDDEYHLYHLVSQGDSSAISLGYEKFTGCHNGTLSLHPLRNIKYHFVVETAQTARACIHGGMDYQTAYSLSDLYIQKADVCPSIPELNELYMEMITDYIHRMRAVRRERIDSKPVQQCADYIYYHLHEKITVPILAEHTGLHPNYLSTLFKKTMGCSITQYIRSQKLTAAKNMLKYSSFPISEICSLLSLGTQSHFTELMKADCGYTPKQYRDRYYEYHQQAEGTP
ncbi:AraC family transcriptional regulator [Lacrimispora sp. 210928-DFI.3.58]|uniref:AraC family transcriptional regulator n=1 Tax=Lacrimispora sp. 210928-DFI.3.58 TaxID=2883214 RepID=UPI0015B4255C|nr:AraC family transcriptional regulator [Lacrimispora sp. 210928-DFI.3.58]MCB7317204.1 AraC family transcriptional regulator [Lacrimispora sp. 210928-DFI.3.58]